MVWKFIAKKAIKATAKKIGKKKAKKSIVKNIAKRNIFKRGAKKVAGKGLLLGGAAMTFGSVIDSISYALTSSEFILPALGAAAGTYGIHKIKSAINNKKANKTSSSKSSQQHTETNNNAPVPLEKMNKKQLRQVRKLTPQQIYALQQAKHSRAA